MLSQILTEFENTTRGLCLEEIAQRIGKDPSVVVGALDLLVNLGKLDETDRSLCDLCPVHDMCNLIINPKRIYILTPNKP